MKNKLILLLLLLVHQAATAANINNTRIVSSIISVDVSMDYQAVEAAAKRINEMVGFTLFTPILENVDYKVSADTIREFMSWFAQNNDGIVPLYHGRGVANVTLAAAARCKNCQYGRVSITPTLFDTLEPGAKAAVVGHELGHIAGLDHAVEGVFAGMGAHSIIQLTEDDKEGLLRLYDAENKAGYGSVAFNGELLLLKNSLFVYGSTDGILRAKPGKYTAVLNGLNKGTIKVKKNERIVVW